MAPFNTPTAVLSGFKERSESLLVQGDRLYIGTATGNIHIYDLHDGIDSSSNPTMRFVEVKKAISRKAIDQLGYIKDINSLVVLSESLPTLYPLPSLSPPTPLAKAKGALSFAIHSSVHNAPNASDSSRPGGFDSADADTIPIPTMVTMLVVGCRRRVVVYTWRDGEAQEIKEALLPHSPRAMAFLDSSNVCFAYSPTEHAIFSLENSTTVDVTMPAPVPTSSSSTGLGMGTFSGLGLSNYMTLGLGAKAAKPGLVRVGDGEVVIIRESQGVVVGGDGRMKGNSINWPTQPEDIAYVNPYIFSILPPGTVLFEEGSDGNSSSSPPPISTSPQIQIQVQGQSQPSLIPAPVVQIISSINMLPVQTFAFPFSQSSTCLNTSSIASVTNTSLRLLTTCITPPPSNTTTMTITPKTPPPLFLVSTSLDRTLAAAEGTTVWRFTMREWDAQINELVERGSYTDALALLERVQGPGISPKRTLILALNAVSHFRAGRYDAAIDTFLDLDINPAKVIALYPERVAGRLAVRPEQWVSLFEGPGKGEDAMSTKSSDGGSKENGGGSGEKLPISVERAPSPAGSMRARTKTSFGALLPSAVSKDDDVASLSGRKKGKVFGVPLTELSEEELVKRAQIVDTALFKSYLIGRPSMLGPLCRLANWCDVGEVEEELRAREKHAELIYLYNGKKMHAKALKLLQQLSEKEDDMRDKLDPSISYLQKLGPEYLDQIFASARWIFEQDGEMAFKIFTSDDVELPRGPVTDYLEKIDPQIASQYLEYLINEREETSVGFHDRLTELYLGITMNARKRGDEKKRGEVYAKLLRFIDTTEHYRPARLYGLLSEDLYEARAILLGRMNRHEHALELYVYKLGDFAKAEEHCKRISSPSPPPSPIFLTLLKLYLRPTIPNPPNFLAPALSLIARHRTRLDPIETLQLLPPFVSAQDVKPFLAQALRAPVFDNAVVREVNKARHEGVERKLMVLESRRVKVTDSRICPQCHKRLGNSVIAVHAPRGEVTHYQCREAFSKKLNAMRHG
ncbi:hypothetical protein PAXINDRAFT_164538 [Paxillus involutus ATCC 200175]|uniref:CNH domain-containing protein n=1 Tax=Paxillus involutus ATCC 200175 TaxID=664439 RepID=A0A0C9T9Y3_PAXIN|nr:hypothetical protein PAXINDRAFT_164538 [Paxillus involutus ATCC 200175]